MGNDRIAIDTGPLALHFADDRRVRETMTRIQKGGLEGHTCELNMAELYYKTSEKFGSDVAEIRSASVRRSAIQIHPAVEALTRISASLKCKYRGKISLADAYILAVSTEYKCNLVTTDPVLKELDLVPTSLLSIG